MKGLKPNLESEFHIDLEWWKKNGRNFRLYLHGLLCESCRLAYPSYKGTDNIDWIDPLTAEVREVDALWQSIRSHCSKEPGYISETTPMAMAIFRALIASGNFPLSPVELYQRIGKGSPEVILRVLAGDQTYYGIVPTPPEEEKG